MNEELPDLDLPTSDEELLEYSTAKRLKNRILIFLGVLLLLALLAGVLFAVVAMVNNPVKTETIRDIMIIFLAIEFSIISLVLIILIVQLALLTELLRNEVSPILKSTNETLANVRGTSEFLSDNLVKPVVKVNSSFAAMRRAFDILRRR
jgi:membrane protein required for beta-lactamase induction